jgi:hypothetical protein
MQALERIHNRRVLAHGKATEPAVPHQHKLITQHIANPHSDIAHQYFALPPLGHRALFDHGAYP